MIYGVYKSNDIIMAFQHTGNSNRLINFYNDQESTMLVIKSSRDSNLHRIWTAVCR